VNLVDIQLGSLLGDSSLDHGVSITNEIGSPVVVSGLEVESVLSLDISNDRDGGCSDDAHGVVAVVI